jgi:hypothetical protein
MPRVEDPQPQRPYRLVALRGSISFPGEDRTFTTLANPAPPIDTGPAPPTGTEPVPPTGTGPPSPGGAAAPVDTLARIVSTAKAACKRSRRWLTCTVTAQGTGTVKLKLRKGRRTLARGSGQIGPRIRLSRRVKPGRYRLRIAITDSASGRRQTINRAVRVR